MPLADDPRAKGTIRIVDATKLSPEKWAVQEKVDGAYAQVHLDARGRVERLIGRNAQPLSGGVADDLIGCGIGMPNSVLAAELEAHTEAANRAIAARGYRCLHLFDAIRVDGVYLGHHPYNVRRDMLWAMQERARAASLVSARPKAGQLVGVPRDWRRAPIVEQFAPALAAELWDRAQVGACEGLVVVALDAPIGKRGAKRKCKPTTTIDAVVVRYDDHAALLLWQGKHVVVSRRGTKQIAVGQVVEVLCDGYYDSGLPRFARIARLRPDLRGTL